MKTQNMEKRVLRKMKEEIQDPDRLPQKSKAKKPQRGRKNDFYYDDGDKPEDEDY